MSNLDDAVGDLGEVLVEVVGVDGRGPCKGKCRCPKIPAALSQGQREGLSPAALGRIVSLEVQKRGTSNQVVMFGYQ